MAINNTENKNKKPNVAEETAELGDGERRRLHKMLRITGFRRKNGEKQRRSLPKIVDTIKQNEERLENEKRFAHNVAVTSKHERRRRWKVRWRLYTFLIVGGLILVMAGYLLYAYVLVVSDITVVGASRYTAEEVIAGSGITVGTKLLSPSLDTDASAEAITDMMPYISKVTIKRGLPGKITITVEEDEAVFKSLVFGKYLLLSSGLRVLDITDSEPEDASLINLKLSRVSRAVLGKELTFEDEDLFDVVEKAVQAVAGESMRQGTSVLDVTDRFNISISYGGRFRIELGLVNDIDLKLRAAFAVMKENIFNDGNKGMIDVRNVSEPTVIIDNEIDLE